MNMKNILTKLSTLLIVLALSTNLMADGTEPTGNPRQVSTLDHLLWISTNNTSWGDDFEQTADIDASETSNWNTGDHDNDPATPDVPMGFSPIGSSATDFTGSYDGGNNSITGLYINRLKESGNGFFGNTEGAAIQNLGIVDFEYITEGQSIGGLVGFLFTSSVTNCYSTGTLIGKNDCGGLVGLAATTSNIIDSHSTASVSATARDNGGLVGQISESFISNCYSTGSVTSPDDRIGGLVGEAYGSVDTPSTITDCYSTGSVSGDDYVGGLVGTNKSYSTINNSYSTGTVIGDDDYIGGLLGSNQRFSPINNCYSTGSVSGDRYIGGLVGNNYNTINNSYSTGSVTGNSYFGGLIGYHDDPSGAVTNSFWDMETSNQATSAAGTGKSTAEMKDIETFTNTATVGLTTAWDFATIWNIESGDCISYPFLIDNEQSPAPGHYCPLFYKSIQSGNWSTLGTWKISATIDGSYTTDATEAPTASNCDGIIIDTDVTVDGGVSIDQTTINSGATLIVNSGVTLTIADDGTSAVDLTVTGTITETGDGALATEAGSTVLYNGANQDIVAAAYSELQFSGTSSVKTFADGTTSVAQEISLTDAITLTGSNAENVTVQVTTPGAGGTASRVFNIDVSSSTVNISNMSVKGGDISGLTGDAAQGGGIVIVSGELNLTNSTVTGSKAIAGGGIRAYKDLNLISSTISNNIASDGNGGGICGIPSSDASITIESSTISGNTSPYNGGAMYTANCTIVMSNSTISGNTADGNGSGFYSYQGTLYLKNSILAGNSNNDDYYSNNSPIGDNGYNVVEYANVVASAATSIIFNQGTSTGAWSQGTTVLTNQTLGLSTSLADNGGTTQTLALAEGSFAAASATTGIPSASNWNNSPLIDGTYTDQRGVVRTADQYTSIGAYSENYLSTPIVTTQAVSAISTTTATGNGEITNLGASDPTEHGVCWSTTASPTTGDNKTEQGGVSATGVFTSNITGLTAGTIYYVRAYATNSVGTSYGDEVSFTSLIAPTVTTQAVSSIGTTTATGNGNITVLGVPNPTQHGVCWSTSTSPTTADSKTEEGAASATGTFTSDITGLTAGTTYYVRAYATNSVGTSYGDEVSFTSLIAPTVTTQAVSSISTTTATGNGNITDLGVPNPTQHGIIWSTSNSPNLSDSKTEEGAASSTGAFTSNIIGLTEGTLYYVRSYATNTAGTSYGNVVSFTSYIAPTVTTQAVSDITTTTATGNGNITGLGIPNPTQYGVCWSTTTVPTISGSKTEQGGASTTGAFTSNITGLTAGTVYYVRAYATNSVETSYGDEVSFTSLIAPTVTTQAVSDITSTTATGNGNITNLGVPNPTQYGVCWSTSANPTTADSKTEKGAASATGVFTSSITSLIEGTMYYVRAYATNEAGTSYGDEVSFTTHITPTVTTQAVSDIISTTATGNGNITDLGIPNPTQHGVCWSLSTNPTTADSKTEEGAASTTGTFTSNITGLTEELTYYVRAYAINSVGTSYGNEVSFMAISTPSTQASEIAVSDVQNTHMTINWTDGSGAKRAVFAMQINASKSPTAMPVDGTTYIANPVYGSGSQIGTSGWYCVYNGTEATTTITGLTPNTNYRFMVCEYNGSPGNEYYNSDTETNNPFEISSVPISDWAVYIGILLIGGFVVIRYRKRLAINNI